MTLLEMSVVYAEHAAVIRSRIVELRGLTRQETDPEAVQALKRRVAALLPLWQEARDLARLTAHYYDYDKEAHRSDQSGRQGRSISGRSGQLAAGKRPG